MNVKKAIFCSFYIPSFSKNCANYMEVYICSQFLNFIVTLLLNMHLKFLKHGEYVTRLFKASNAIYA